MAFREGQDFEEPQSKEKFPKIPSTPKPLRQRGFEIATSWGALTGAVNSAKISEPKASQKR